MTLINKTDLIGDFSMLTLLEGDMVAIGAFVVDSCEVIG